MTSHVVKPLTPETFSAWLALAQKHNGVWGGCYCSYFHGDTECTVKSESDGPMFKQRLVAKASHRPLVFDGDAAIAWCEFGSPVELPRIYHRKGTRAMFEKAGFTFERHIGKSKTVMRKTIPPARG